MTIGNISAYSASSVYTSTTSKANKTSSTTETKESSTTSTSSAGVNPDVNAKVSDYAAEGVVYEKTDRSALIEQLKADAQSQKDSLISMVREALGQQASTSSLAMSEDDIWKVFASGEFTVDEAAKAKAQEAISENGYWGVEQTSERILQFAKALTGDDVSKADEMLEAFEKGYKQATKSWGQTLPDISQQTYDRVQEKFQEWKDSVNGTQTQA